MDEKLLEEINMQYEARKPDFGISAHELAARKGCTLAQARRMLSLLEEQGALTSKLMLWQKRIVRIYYKTEERNELQAQRRSKSPSRKTLSGLPD